MYFSLNEVFGSDEPLDADDAGDFYAALINNNGHIVMPKYGHRQPYVK